MGETRWRAAERVVAGVFTGLAAGLIAAWIGLSLLGAFQPSYHSGVFTNRPAAPGMFPHRGPGAAPGVAPGRRGRPGPGRTQLG